MLQREAPAGREGLGTPSQFELREYLTALRKRAPMIGLTTLLAGGAAFTAASLLPKKYISVTYLELSEAEARKSEVIMRSPAIYDPIIARFPLGTDVGIDESRREMARRIYVTTPPGDVVGKRTGWSMVKVTGPSPQIAQSMATLLLDTWMEIMKPRPVAQERVRGSIHRTETQLKAVENLIRRLEADIGAAQSERVSKLIKETAEAGGPVQTEAGWPLTNLLLQRERLVETGVKLKLELEGTTRDVIIVQPTLPSEPSAPKPLLIAVLASLATLALAAAWACAELGIRTRLRAKRQLS